MVFNGQTVRIALGFRGLSQRDLAEAVAASSSTIASVEAGHEPRDDLRQALAECLRVDSSFFYQTINDEFLEGECNFRRRVTAPERLRRRVLAHGTLFAMVVRYLSERVALPKLNIPRVRIQKAEDIESAAARVRAQWRLGADRPILTLGRALERAGIVLTRLDAESAKVDAFSRYGQVCVIVLNTTKGSTSRTRFDMAHELGHLAMHRDLPTGNPEREAEADRFAAALLLPRKAFAREFWSAGRVDWPHMFELKRRWRVSVAAIVRRAYDLGLIEAMQYRRAYKLMSVRGWLKGEPAEPEAERPELFRLALEELEKLGEPAHEVARNLGWSSPMFEAVTGLRLKQPVEPPPGVVSLDKYRRTRAAGRSVPQAGSSKVLKRAR